MNLVEIRYFKSLSLLFSKTSIGKIYDDLLLLNNLVNRIAIAITIYSPPSLTNFYDNLLL